jgi:hypothetical protein
MINNSIHNAAFVILNYGLPKPEFKLAWYWSSAVFLPYCWFLLAESLTSHLKYIYFYLKDYRHVPYILSDHSENGHCAIKFKLFYSLIIEILS